jgi:hypothetical protein
MKEEFEVALKELLLKEFESLSIEDQFVINRFMNIVVLKFISVSALTEEILKIFKDSVEGAE